MVLEETLGGLHGSTLGAVTAVCQLQKVTATMGVDLHPLDFLLDFFKLLFVPLLVQ